MIEPIAQGKAESAPLRDAPTPKGAFLLGHIGPMTSDPLAFLLRVRAELGDVVRLRLGQSFHLVSHPDGVKHVLQDRHAIYPKDFTYGRLKPVVGEGLLTSEGDFWRRQRRLAQPAFHKGRLAAFARTMAECGEDLCGEWREPARGGATVDVAAAMMKVTLRIVSKTLFGGDVVEHVTVLSQAVPIVLGITNERLKDILFTPWFPSPRNLRFKRSMRVLNRVVDGLIDARRKSSEEREDLLGMLMSARDEETGEQMSDRQLRDEVMTLFLAGHETTANALNWTFHLLASHPEVEARLAAEVADVLGGRAPALEDVPRLRYTLQVIEETMRLYPPAWLISRQPLEDDAIGGVRIPKSTIVFLSPWVTHRHPDVWSDPERFDPDRFTPERSAERARYAYFPFAGGPRQCIGNNFALMEAQILLAQLVQRFRLRPAPGVTIGVDPSVTLRPRNGLPMVLEERTR